MKTLQNGIFAIVVIAVVMTVGSLTIRANEVETCNDLLAQSTAYATFYLTTSEKEMCDSRKIVIDAPVYAPSDCVNGVSEDVPRCPVPLELFTANAEEVY